MGTMALDSAPGQGHEHDSIMLCATPTTPRCQMCIDTI